MNNPTAEYWNQKPPVTFLVTYLTCPVHHVAFIVLAPSTTSFKTLQYQVILLPNLNQTLTVLFAM